MCVDMLKTKKQKETTKKKTKNLIQTNKEKL